MKKMIEVVAMIACVNDTLDIVEESGMRHLWHKQHGLVRLMAWQYGSMTLPNKNDEGKWYVLHAIGTFQQWNDLKARLGFFDEEKHYSGIVEYYMREA